MAARNTVRAELEEQRCLIGRQQIEIQRQRRRIELQLKLTGDMQLQLDRIESMLRRAAPIHSPTQTASGDGNGHGHHTSDSSQTSHDVRPRPSVI